MGFQLTLAKVNNSTSKGVCYLNDFSPYEPDTLEARGRFINFITLKLETGSAVDSMVYARQVLGKLHSEYFADVQKSIHNCLKDTLNVTSQEFSGQGFELSISSMVLPQSEDKIYVATLGRSSVFLLRNNSYATILSGVDTEKVVAASGVAKDGDVMVLSNNEFLQHISVSSLAADKEKNTELEIFSKKIEEGLKKTSSDHPVGCVLVQFNEPLHEEQEFRNLKTQQATPVLVETKNEQPQSSGRLEKLKSFIPKRRLYIDPDMVSVDSIKSKRNTLIVGLILLVILLVGTYLGAKRKQKLDYKQSYTGQLTEAQQKFDQSKELVGLDDIKSREAYLAALSQVDLLIESGIKEPEVLELKNQIDQARAELLKEVVTNQEVFVDLSLLSEDFNSIDTYLYEDEMYVLDKEGRIAKINTQSKSAEIIAGPTLVGTDTDSITAYDKLVFLLKNSREIEIIFGDGLEAPSTEYVTGRILMDTFAGNIYVLERAQNMIFRHQRLTQGYGDAEEWLAEGIEPDFSDASDVVIDGMIWVGYEDGTISKFSNGLTQPFVIQGVTPEISSVDLIYSGEDTENIYAFDSMNSRIVVLNKDGEFVLQYILGNTEDIAGIVALEDQNKMLITQADKIYEIELK